jgi:Lrp/AsnC family transcriptional regulator, leucine-responsive regulatory protein
MQPMSAGCSQQDAGVTGQSPVERSNRSMDDKDILLLSLLRRDARLSFVALARELGLSRSATQDRLARLRSSGAIKGFTIIDGDAGKPAQTAHMTIRFVPGMTCAQVLPRLRRLPLVTAIHSVAGEIDLVLRVDAPDIAGIESMRVLIAAIPGIAHVTTLITLERHMD